MAVYTHVSPDQVAAFLSGRGLGDYKSHEGITQGVENTNYHLFTTTGRYILTIFEKRVDPKGLPFIFAFIKHLANAGIPVPGLVGDVGTLAGKAAAISEFLPGKDIKRDTITPDHCAQAGAILGRMHKAAETFTQERANEVGPDAWRRLLDAARQHEGAILPEAVLQSILSDYGQLDKSVLPRGAVHVDYFQDNVFFDESGKFSGVIDFYFACTDTFVYDLAISINCWCFDMNNVPVPARVAAFMQGYEGERKLTQEERAAWPVMRRAAALRYFSTRIYDWVFTPADADVKKHDPSEYLAKMEAECPLP